MVRKRAVTTSDALPELHHRNKNNSQQEAFDAYATNDILFLLGPAGTGKTHVAVYCAMYDLLARIKQRRVERIIITRPIVEAGESLGFLPGEMEDKVHPYMIPIYDVVGKMVPQPVKFIEEFFTISPLAYQRGVTFENCVAILDEAQNCTLDQLKLFMTRLGVGGKLIIAGDTEQSDIGKKSGLKAVVTAMEGEPGIATHRFTDEHCVRHPLVTKVLKRWPK